MSDSSLKYVPKDPGFQPSRVADASATELLKEFLPQSDKVTSEFSENYEFFGPLGNWAGVRCHQCGADVETWFGDAVPKALEKGVLEVTTPCCGATVSLNELTFGWNAAFGKYSLEAMNPNVEKLTEKQLKELSGRVGSPLTEIQVHF